jgi:hypothetical protein
MLKFYFVRLKDAFGRAKVSIIILNAMLHGLSGGQNQIFRRGGLPIDGCKKSFFCI